MAFWIVWLVIGIFFILAFSVTIIPKIMLKLYAASLPVRVKAVDRQTDEFGDVLVYASPSSVKKYIKTYRIGRNAGGVYFRGELGERAAFLEYEITVYGADGAIKEILRVKEKFNGGSYTHDTALPEATDYVTLRLVCVDDNPVSCERRSFNASYLFWLVMMCLSLALAVDLLLWLGITFTMRCMDRFTMQLELPIGTWAAILGFAALAIAVFACLFALGSFFMRGKGVEDE